MHFVVLGTAVQPNATGKLVFAVSIKRNTVTGAERLLGEEGRGFVQQVPLHPEDAVLGAQPLQFVASAVVSPSWRRPASRSARRRVRWGAKPGDLPIEQAREFDFVINLKTPQARGLTTPEHVLLQATDVIQ